MTDPQTLSYTLDLNCKSAAVDIPVLPHKGASIQVTSGNGSWSTAVVTVQRSTDGRVFTDLEPARAITGPEWVELPATNYAVLRLIVTTPEGSSAEANIGVTLGKAPSLPYPAVVPPPIYRYLDENGDGTGNKDATGNYSGAVTEFKITPPSDKVFRISRLIVAIRDGNGMSPQEYGNLGTSLSNGISMQIRDASGTVENITDDLPITTNAEWAQLAFDSEISNYGSGNEYVRVRLTFANAGFPLRIDGTAGQYFAILLNDNLSGLTQHRFAVEGYEEL